MRSATRHPSRAAATACASAAVACLLGVGFGSAHAQEAPRWSGGAQVSLQHTTGTSEFTALMASHDLRRDADLHLELHTGVGYGRSSFSSRGSDGVHRTHTDIRRSAIADALLRWPARKRVYAPLRLLLERDDNQNIDRRLHAGLGVGAYLVRAPRQTLQLEVSAGPIRERDADGSRHDYAAGAALLDHELSWGTHGGSLSSRIECVRAFRDDEGRLLRGRTSLNAPLGDRIGLSVAYTVLYDTTPAGSVYDPESEDEVVTASARTTTSLNVGVRFSW